MRFSSPIQYLMSDTLGLEICLEILDQLESRFGQDHDTRLTDTSKVDLIHPLEESHLQRVLNEEKDNGINPDKPKDQLIGL